jgi:endonuclease YncB( thermonuclease family)
LLCGTGESACWAAGNSEPASQQNGKSSVSLNHKRRIFRSGAGLRSAWPPPAVWLAAAGGLITLLVAGSLFVRSSEAPARAPALSHLSAESDQLAVLDGDTLRVGEHVVRLAGIAAPQRGSVCHGEAQTELDCGSAAANALAALVRGRFVDCAIRGHDPQGRPAADCSVGGRRLNVALVQDGWARAEAADLQDAEAAARAAGRGIWRLGS